MGSVVRAAVDEYLTRKHQVEADTPNRKRGSMSGCLSHRPMGRSAQSRARGSCSRQGAPATESRGSKKSRLAFLRAESDVIEGRPGAPPLNPTAYALRVGEVGAERVRIAARVPAAERALGEIEVSDHLQDAAEPRERKFNVIPFRWSTKELSLNLRISPAVWPIPVRLLPLAGFVTVMVVGRTA